MMDARTGGEVDVAAAARDDHVRAHLEKLAERLRARDRDDPRRLVDLVFREVRKAAQAGQLLARLQLSLEEFLRDFGVEVADLELRDPVLLGELLYHRHEV